MTKPNSKELWDEYILWLSMPPHERGAVATEEDWAKSKGFADSRTTRRWKNNPDFIERQRRLTESMAAKTGALVVHGDEEVAIDSEERDYRLVKTKLVESAKGGNLKAQELFMKLYGKSWLDDEAAARTSDFSNMALPDLVAKAVGALEPEQLAGALRDIGWTVQEPEGSHAGNSRI